MGNTVVMKECSHCHKARPAERFSPIKCRGGALNAWCKDCTADSARKWYHANREKSISRNNEWRENNWGKVLAASKKYSAKRRDETLIAIGGPLCVCCGETERSFLDIDHVNGGGNKHRKTVPDPNAFYKYVASHPSEFQVLCCNCNHSKRRLGACAHGNGY